MGHLLNILKIMISIDPFVCVLEGLETAV